MFDLPGFFAPFVIYAGIFALPFILLMSLTGLVILYTQPIQDTLDGDLRTVEESGRYVSFDQQAKAAEQAHRLFAQL